MPKTQSSRFKAQKWLWPIDAWAMLSAKPVKNATLKICPDESHSLGDTSKEQLDADLLAFIKG